MNNDMVAQLTVLIRQVALLNNRAQPNNEAHGICGVFSHGVDMCPQNLYKPEQINS